MNTIDTMRQIIKEHTAQEIDGVLVDTTSAHVVISIYDKLNPQNQQKFLGLDIVNMVTVAWKVLEKAS